MQNACVCVVMIHSKRDHVTPMLLELHWLPVKCRITFKTLLLTFICVKGSHLHTYHHFSLSLHLSLYYLPRCLHSSDKLLLKQPTSRNKIGERAFSWSAPRDGTNCPSQCTNERVLDSSRRPSNRTFKNYFMII